MPLHDFRPGLAGVVRAVNMRAQIVEPERVDRRIGGVRIEVAGVDERNFLPRPKSAAA